MVVHVFFLVRPSSSDSDQELKGEEENWQSPSENTSERPCGERRGEVEVGERRRREEEGEGEEAPQTRPAADLSEDSGTRGQRDQRGHERETLAF